MVEIVSADGRKVKKTSIEASKIAWSPDGKKLVIANYNNTGGVYDVFLNKVALLPNKNILNSAWLNNDTVLYTADHIMWSYSISKSQSTAVSSLSPDLVISEIAISQDKSYVYLSAQSDDKGEIMRVGLNGQKTPDFVYQLDVFFPKSLSDYQIKYVNFTKPTILVQSYSDSPSKNYIQAASTELQADGFDVSKLEIKYSPS
jgi:DNA-binding beta-propeller fold protein YncE